MMASERGHYYVCDWLVDFGADLEVKDMVSEIWGELI